MWFPHSKSVICLLVSVNQWDRSIHSYNKNCFHNHIFHRLFSQFRQGWTPFWFTGKFWHEEEIEAKKNYHSIIGWLSFSQARLLTIYKPWRDWETDRGRSSRLFAADTVNHICCWQEHLKFSPEHYKHLW